MRSQVSLRWLPCVAVAAIAATMAALAPAQPAADPREKDVRDLIDRYFLTWSAKDIDRYGQCFASQAAIQLLDPAGKLTTLPLRAFLETQRDAHRNSAVDMKETPESVEVRFEGKLARVVVHWKLVAGERTEVGYDHFTLMPVGGQWRIANLIFYETPPAAK